MVWRLIYAISFIVIAIWLVYWQIKHKKMTGAIPVVVIGVIICLAIAIFFILDENAMEFVPYP